MKMKPTYVTLEVLKKRTEHREDTQKFSKRKLS